MKLIVDKKWVIEFYLNSFTAIYIFFAISTFRQNLLIIIIIMFFSLAMKL